MYRYYGKNVRSFSAVCQNNYGRKIIYTLQKSITRANILDELSKALLIHNQNALEIEYLDRYYRGDQPILYRKKVNRPEVNNRVVTNLAYEVVERKVANICAEPIQYVLFGTDDKKAEETTALNNIMTLEDKQECDISICRWRSICGSGYRFIDNDNGNGALLDESDFSLSSEHPAYTFVAYFTNNRPAFSCQIRENGYGKTVYFCYTRSEYFEICDGEIISSGINGNNAIPVVEYPNNERRLSDIEITIGITDALNVLSSDRINGIEQFVSAWVKFVNCEVDAEQFRNMRMEGALVVKSNNGDSNKADVDVMSNELNQTEGQVVMNDMLARFLDIQGLSTKDNQASGDTGAAVYLRNGHIDNDLRAAINEPILKHAEMQSLRIILNRLRITKKFILMPSDIEIHINHNKLDNLMTKSEALKMLLDAGIYYKRAIKEVDLFSDPEQVAAESRKRMEMLYPDEEKEETSAQPDSNVDDGNGDTDIAEDNNAQNTDVKEKSGTDG